MLSRDWVGRKRLTVRCCFKSLRIAIHRKCEFETLLAKLFACRAGVSISSLCFGIGLSFIGFTISIRSLYDLLKISMRKQYCRSCSFLGCCKLGRSTTFQNLRVFPKKSVYFTFFFCFMYVVPLMKAK